MCYILLCSGKNSAILNLLAFLCSCIRKTRQERVPTVKLFAANKDMYVANPP